MFSPINFFLGIFVLVGLLLAGYGARNVWRDRASVDWPKTTGEVLRSSVEENSDGEGTSYKAAVEYRYIVNGKAYVGKRISFGTDGGLSGRGAANHFVSKYSPGRGVFVHYRADQPELCTLEPGLTKRSFSMVAFGLMFAVFALWFRLLWWLMT